MSEADKARPATATVTLDIAANRRAQKWSRSELAARTAWEFLRAPLFAWTPRPLWAWRRMILRLFGACIGRDVHIHPSAQIAIPWNISIEDNVGIGEGAILYSLGRIDIGAHATISQYAHLCAGTHDYTRPEFPLVKMPIVIGSGAWVCADAFIGPGVTIGAGAIVGARAVAMKDVPLSVIVAGNPASHIRKRPALSD